MTLRIGWHLGIGTRRGDHPIRHDDVAHVGLGAHRVNGSALDGESLRQQTNRNDQTTDQNQQDLHLRKLSHHPTSRQL